MARHIKVIQDTHLNGKLWIAGSIHTVGSDLAKKLIEEKKAAYSTGSGNELVEAIKKVTRKRK